MRTILTLQDMQDINQILSEATSPSQFVHQWDIKIPDEVDFKNQPRTHPELEKSFEFTHDLFVYYKSNKLSTYKKVFDFAFHNDIDLFTIFHNLVFQSHKLNYKNMPEYLDLINYVYQKNYFQPGHDFSVYFNQFNKPTNTNISAQIKLLTALDNSEKSFDIYCKLFDSDLRICPYPDNNRQEKIKNLFKKFEQQDFFVSKKESHEKFYPNLLQFQTLSQLQEDDYFSKRFCFSSDHRVSTLAKNIENSLSFIYNLVFDDLKERQLLADFYTFNEQGSFYLYVFTDTPESLKHLGKTIGSFHSEIQGFLQNNSETHDYYIKLFNSISLAEKLASKPIDLPKTKTHTRKI
ncbi:MAG: hypothetical protein K2P52_00680 [Campylobacterales bacterium]|nr:hypothetical protein [Campylobacterales bacterium]